MAPTGPDNLQHDLASPAAQRDAMTADGLLASALAFWRSALLLSAHELGLFTELAAGPHDAATLERRLGLRRDASADFLACQLGVARLHGQSRFVLRACCAQAIGNIRPHPVRQ